MKENNLQKKPRDFKEYANFFLLDENGKKRDFSGVSSVCLITIGHAETLWILLQEFAGKDITIIDRKSEIDFIETLKKLHNRDDIRIAQKFEVETEEAVLNTILDLNMSFDLIIANPPYSKNTYIDILEAIKTTNPKQITFLCPWSFTNNVKAGKKLKEEIESFVSSYTQLDGTELFGITLKLLVFHANFEKRTNNKFSTLKPGSIEESIVNKGLSHSDMLKDRVFWISGLSGSPMPVKVNENIEKQLKNGYDGWIFRTVSLARIVQKALVKTENGIASGGVGVKTKEDYERLSECIKSKDFCSFVRFVLKVIGDGRDMYSREIPYIPLFTSFKELNLTAEEIERVGNM